MLIKSQKSKFKRKNQQGQHTNKKDKNKTKKHFFE